VEVAPQKKTACIFDALTFLRTTTTYIYSDNFYTVIYTPTRIPVKETTYR
jgi:hypothetical protein